MLVKINKNKINLIFPIPLSLFFNRLTYPLIAHYATKYTKGLILETQHLYELFECLKKSKRQMGHYELVRVESSDGIVIVVKM